MRSNLDISRLQNAASLARAVRQWIEARSHPERYASVQNLELVRDFVHTLDLLETVLVRFEICTHLIQLALEELEEPGRVGSLGWEFWQVDIEEFFAANLLEVCHQISNAWLEMQKFAQKDEAFAILRTPHLRLPDTILARHIATHFAPAQFESHHVAQQYSILRRPYHMHDGKLEKELAKDTMTRVVALIQATVADGYNYLDKLREATIG